MTLAGAYISIYGHIHYYLVDDGPLISESLLVSSGLQGGSEAVAALYGTIRNTAAMIMGRGV